MTPLAFGKRSPLAALFFLPWMTACSAPADEELAAAAALTDAGTVRVEDAARAPSSAPDAQSSPAARLPIWDAGCTPALIGHERIAASISIVVGSSATMAQGFGKTTRWGAVRGSVVGFASELASSARVGVAVVGGPAQHLTPTAGPACASIERVAPALGSLAALTAALAAPPEASAASAISVGVAAATEDLAGLAASGPVHLVLVVDALPSSCTSAATSAGLDEAALSVARAAIDTRVIVVGSDLGDADAGRLSTAGAFTRALDEAGLARAFAALSAELAPCAFALGTPVDPAASTTVTMGRARLAAGKDYTLSQTKLVLLDGACNALKATPADVAVTLPCPP